MKLFLPVIQKANLDLESQIKAEGLASVQIDANICQGSTVAGGATNNSHLIVDATEEIEEGDVESAGEDTSDGPTSNDIDCQEDRRQVQLELVIGDIDDSIGDQIEGSEDAETAN